MLAILVGLFLTAAWGYVLWRYVESQIGFDLLPALLPSELAILVLAAVTPVAAIWLTIAVFALARRVLAVQARLEAAARASARGAGEEGKPAGAQVASLKRAPTLAGATPKPASGPVGGPGGQDKKTIVEPPPRDGD